MIRSLLFFMAVTCTNLADAQDGRSYEINGYIENKPDGLIFLQVKDQKGNIETSRSPIKDNRFYFKGVFAERAKASFIVNGYDAGASFFMDSGKIEVQLKNDTIQRNGKREPVFRLATIQGSHSQQLWDETMDHFRKIRECEAPDSVKSEDHFHLMKSLVEKYPDLYVTKELLLIAPMIAYPEYKQLIDQLPKQTYQTPIDRSLERQLAHLKATEANTYIFFPTQKSSSGKAITLDDLDFKYLLIDFWASWCGPCRFENPAMKKLYAQYKPAGLEILSISLDEDEAKWRKAIADDKLPWPQASDLKGYRTEIVDHYRIGGIPYNLLIDRTGLIVAKDLHGINLQKKIASLLKTK